MNDQRLICSDIQPDNLDNVDNDWLLHAENKIKQKRLWGRKLWGKGSSGLSLVLRRVMVRYSSVIYWSAKIASIEFNYPNKRVSPGFEWIWDLVILASDQKYFPP